MLTINARFLSQPLTGVQRYAWNVARHLPEAMLISDGRRAPWAANAELNGRLMERRSILGSHLWDQLVLPRAMPPGARLFCPGGIAPFAVRRAALTVHDFAVLDHPEYYGAAFGTLYRRLLPATIRRVRLIFTVSHWMRGEIVNRFGVAPDRVMVTPNAADSVFRPRNTDDLAAMREVLGLHRPYLLGVGAVSPRKNLARLLGAWSRIQHRFPDHELVLVGAEGLRFAPGIGLPALPQRARALGALDDETLARVYAGAALFVYPSLYEGFGIPILEAMACGVPVVTSSVTAMPEVAGDLALLVPPANEAAIAEAIAAGLTDEAWRRQAHREGPAHAARYRWEDAAAAVRRAAESRDW